ncbi:MAG: GC-type dockerin domain-anchored protein [Phycisphaerales bacterium JB040]
MSSKGLITTGSIVGGGIVVAAVWSISASGGSQPTDRVSQKPQERQATPVVQPVTATPRAIGLAYADLEGTNSWGDPRRNPEEFRQRFEEMQARWDANGDGELDREERRLMWEAMQAQREMEMIERFDRDGDGVLDEDEQRAARLADFLGSDRGQELAREFDANGDGVLDDGELAAMEAHIRAEREARREEWRQRAVDRYDLDGDGELSDIEREIARESAQEQGREYRERMTQQFDSDGDGELSGDERAAAFDHVRSMFQQREFVSDNDANGDGVVNSLDTGDFIDRFTNQNPSADLNGDGVWDTADLDEYNRRIEQGENTMPGEDELPPMGGFRGWGGGGGGRDRDGG